MKALKTLFTRFKNKLLTVVRRFLWFESFTVSWHFQVERFGRNNFSQNKQNVATKWLLIVNERCSIAYHCTTGNNECSTSSQHKRTVLMNKLHYIPSLLSRRTVACAAGKPPHWTLPDALTLSAPILPSRRVAIALTEKRTWKSSSEYHMCDGFKHNEIQRLPWVMKTFEAV